MGAGMESVPFSVRERQGNRLFMQAGTAMNGTESGFFLKAEKTVDGEWK